MRTLSRLVLCILIFSWQLSFSQDYKSNVGDCKSKACVINPQLGTMYPNYNIDSLHLLHEVGLGAFPYQIDLETHLDNDHVVFVNINKCSCSENLVNPIIDIQIRSKDEGHLFNHNFGEVSRFASISFKPKNNLYHIEINILNPEEAKNAWMGIWIGTRSKYLRK